MLKRILLSAVLFSLLAASLAHSTATITNTTGSFNTARAFLSGYYGGVQGGCAYPYHAFSNSTMQQNHTWNVVRMQNNWLTVDVLPEAGGRILKFTNRQTGANQFYENPNGFIHTNWGWYGWSPTGGTEYMFPYDEHFGSFYLPFNDKPAPVTPGYTWLTEDYGPGVRLTMFFDEDTSELFNGTNSRFRLELVMTLPDNEAHLKVNFRLVNESGSSNNLSFWSNSMCSPGSGNMKITSPTANLNQRLIYPKQVTSVYDHNQNYGGTGPGSATIWETLNWPIHSGVDISRTSNYFSQNYGTTGTFVAGGKQATFAGIYNLDTGSDQGIVKTFPSRIATGINTGVKFFTWGNSGYFSENGTTYLEMMTGPVTVFAEPGVECNPENPHRTGETFRISMSPSQELIWTDTYISPYGIRDVVYAEDNCVLNFTAPGSAVCGSSLGMTIGAFPTSHNTNAKIEVDIGGVVIWSQSNQTVGPANPYYNGSATVPNLMDVSSGSQNIRLTFTFDNSSTVSYSQPITISGVCGPTPTFTQTPIPPSPTPVPPSPTPGGDTIIPVPGQSTPWSSTFNGWGCWANQSFPGSGGRDGGPYLEMSRSCGGGSSAYVIQVPIASGKTGNVSGYMRRTTVCEDHWCEYGYRLGGYTAQDFDQNSAQWTMIKKFDAWGLGCGNGNVWTNYTVSVSSGGNTTITLGAKYGSSVGTNTPCGWDDWVVASPLEVDHWMLH